MTKIRGSRQAYQGRVMGVKEVDLEFENGKQATFEVMSFGVITGVAALPMVNEEVILIKHYQAGIGRDGYSLPSGGLNEGEDPYARMNEELMEEIGFRANELTLMSRTDVLPGYVGTESGYLFLARDLVEERQAGDEVYPIQICRLPFREALDMVKKQEITDIRTVCALLWYEHFGVEYSYGRT